MLAWKDQQEQTSGLNQQEMVRLQDYAIILEGVFDRGGLDVATCDHLIVGIATAITAE